MNRFHRNLVSVLAFIHVGAIAALAWLLYLSDVDHDPSGGANIGAGLAGLPLLALGLPWSVAIPLLLDAAPGGGGGSIRFAALVAAPALINAAIVWYCVFRRFRRRAED